MEARQPCSPGTEEVELRECIEELTHFTLRSHLTGALLSTHFCSTLLDSGDYKHLALALHDCISRGGFDVDDGEDEEEKQIGEWSQLVQEEGSVLVNVYKFVNFQLHVQEPYFTQFKDGSKTVEGRCAAGKYNRIRPGALLLFNKCLVVEVQGVHRYASFYEMLKEEGLHRVLPGVSTIDEGVAVYRKFYAEVKEKSNGVLGICVSISASQPYVSLAQILSAILWSNCSYFQHSVLEKSALCKLTATEARKCSAHYAYVLTQGLGDRGILMLMHPPASRNST